MVAGCKLLVDRQTFVLYSTEVGKLLVNMSYMYILSLIIVNNVIKLYVCFHFQTLFTLDNKGLKTPAGRKKKGKENIEHTPVDGPKFAQPSVKGPRGRKKPIAEPTQSSNLVFSVFGDDDTFHTPSIAKSSSRTKAISSSVKKTTTKLNPSAHPASSKQKSRVFDLSFSSNESPTQAFTPRTPARVYSSVSKTKQSTICPPSTKKTIAKTDSVIVISSSDDSPASVPKSTSRTGRTVPLSSKKTLKKTLTAQLSSSSTDSPILPARSCAKIKKPMIESSSESSPDSIKKLNLPTSKYTSKIGTVKPAASYGSKSSSVVTKPKEQSSKLSIDKSSPLHQESNLTDKDKQLGKTNKKLTVSHSSSVDVKKPTTSKSERCTAKVTKNDTKTSMTGVDDSTLPNDSDISLIENSIIEDKPKRAQVFRRPVR